MRDIEPFELDVLYARAKSKLWEKVVRLQRLPELRIEAAPPAPRTSALVRDGPPLHLRHCVFLN